MEIWLPVKGFEGIYEVSNTGRVRSLDRFVKHKNHCLIRGKILKPTRHTKGAGYVSVSLQNNGKETRRNIHRLVAEAFITNPDGKPYINHIDNNPLNNHSLNLEWVYPKEN